MLRLAVYLILCGLPNAVLNAGPECSSWVVVSRGTSLRNWINYRGNESLDFVGRANKMISRLRV